MYWSATVSIWYLSMQRVWTIARRLTSTWCLLFAGNFLILVFYREETPEGDLFHKRLERLWSLGGSQAAIEKFALRNRFLSVKTALSRRQVEIVCSQLGIKVSLAPTKYDFFLLIQISAFIVNMQPPPLPEPHQAVPLPRSIAKLSDNFEPTQHDDDIMEVDDAEAPTRQTKATGKTEELCIATGSHDQGNQNRPFEQVEAEDTAMETTPQHGKTRVFL